MDAFRGTVKSTKNLLGLSSKRTSLQCSSEEQEQPELRVKARGTSTLSISSSPPRPLSLPPGGLPAKPPGSPLESALPRPVSPYSGNISSRPVSSPPETLCPRVPINRVPPSRRRSLPASAFRSISRRSNAFEDSVGQLNEMEEEEEADEYDEGYDESDDSNVEESNTASYGRSFQNNRHALKNLSRSTPAMSPSASPRHSDSEGPPRVSKGTKKFMRHFGDAPPSERVLNYFACALVSDILLQGTLYITPNYFAFYSKIFGHVSRLLIPISQVASVQKERTAKIIPNAVGLQTIDGKSYVFGSLLSRDSTYKLMTHLWKKAQMIQDSDSEPASGVPLTVEDDCDDSGSGSGESFADEDQPDGGRSYLASAAITSLTGVASSAAAPWTSRDTSATTATTTSLTTISAAATMTSTILTSPNIIASSNSSTNTIALSSINEVVPTTVALRRDSLTPTKSSLESSGSEDRGLLGWLTEGTLIKTCCRMGSIPLRLIGDGMREIWALPRTSLLLLISTMLLLMLFASAAFMLHRVDVLSQQLGLEKYDEYDGMYEEVLQMQQRLHAAASSEIEKTLSIQLKHIATVRQSLEALVVLFNKEPPVNTARIPDNT
ncbi:protein Aster-A-like isoform X3 [Palaemon carinicauda]|uniref:protein Aster-A-like isoform X3 n=1 Tax=Palaemon carinicauda TaxID=392227 RepID=UPI0035B645E2